MWASKTIIKIYKISMLFSFLYTIWIQSKRGPIHTYIKYPITSVSLTKTCLSRFFFHIYSYALSHKSFDK